MNIKKFRLNLEQIIPWQSEMGGAVTAGNTERSSNLELFRIIVMLLIIAHHYVVNSGLTVVSGPIFSDPLSAKSIFYLLFGMWGKTGINCFVLITGYFMCTKEITLKKFAKLVLEVEFYKIVIYIIFLLTGYHTFSIVELIKVLLPVTSIAQNFTGCYLVFYLCIPFLNYLIRNISQKQHGLLLVLCVFTYVIIGTIPTFGVTMNYVSWYIVLYFIASYIRLYPNKWADSVKFTAWTTVVLVIVSMCSVIAMEWISIRINKPGACFYFVSDSNKILAVLTGVSLFCLFKNIKIRYSKLINTVASTCFGVLMIHANSDAMRQWLWKDTLNNVGMYDSKYAYIFPIASVLGVFIICSGIDLLRQKYIEKPAFKWLDLKMIRM